VMGCGSKGEGDRRGGNAARPVGNLVWVTVSSWIGVLPAMGQVDGVRRPVGVSLLLPFLATGLPVSAGGSAPFWSCGACDAFDGLGYQGEGSGPSLISGVGRGSWLEAWKEVIQCGAM